MRCFISEKINECGVCNVFVFIYSIAVLFYCSFYNWYFFWRGVLSHDFSLLLPKPKGTIRYSVFTYSPLSLFFSCSSHWYTGCIDRWRRTVVNIKNDSIKYVTSIYSKCDVTLFPRFMSTRKRSRMFSYENFPVSHMKLLTWQILHLFRQRRFQNIHTCYITDVLNLHLFCTGVDLTLFQTVGIGSGRVFKHDVGKEVK